MTPSEIIARARTLSGTDSTNYTDAQGIKDFNAVYQDLISDIITEIDEDYFWDKIVTDSVASQNEYVIDDTQTSPNYRINQVNKVSVKYSDTDAYYTKATRVNPNDFENDEDWYKTNQPKTNPVYYVADDSVFIFPQPDANVTAGIKMNVILQPVDLTINSTEADVVIAPRFHKVISDGIRRFIYAGRQMLAEEQSALALYDKSKREMIGQMKNRDQGVVQVVTGDLSNYA